MTPRPKIWEFAWFALIMVGSLAAIMTIPVLILIGLFA